jgi:hypothetical protein
VCTSFSEPDATNVSEPDGFRLKMSTCQCCEYESIGFFESLNCTICGSGGTCDYTTAAVKAHLTTLPMRRTDHFRRYSQCNSYHSSRLNSVQCSAATNHRFVQPQKTNAVAVRCRARVALRTHRRRRILHGRVYRSEALPACGTPALVSRLCQQECTARHSTARAGRQVGLRTDSAVATLLMNEYRCGLQQKVCRRAESQPKATQACGGDTALASAC